MATKKKTSTKRKSAESSLAGPVSGTYIGTRGLTAKQKRERAEVLKKYGLKETKPKRSK